MFFLKETWWIKSCHHLFSVTSELKQESVIFISHTAKKVWTTTELLPEYLPHRKWHHLPELLTTHLNSRWAVNLSSVSVFSLVKTLLLLLFLLFRLSCSPVCVFNLPVFTLSLSPQHHQTDLLCKWRHKSAYHLTRSSQCCRVWVHVYVDHTEGNYFTSASASLHEGCLHLKDTAANSLSKNHKKQEHITKRRSA